MGVACRGSRGKIGSRHRLSIKSLHVQMKIDNLLNEDYEEVLGFSSAGISVYGGVAVNS
jgi:outer membrane cobalamin receptor